MQEIIDNLNGQALNLGRTLDCGEQFRWVCIRGLWFGVIGEELVEIKADNDSNGLAVQLLTNLSSSKQVSKLMDYLDLYTDYNPIRSMEILKSDQFAARAVNHGWGIRILKQDFWETFISFVISQRNNIPKIKQTIKKLCDVAGHSTHVEDELWGIQPEEENEIRKWKTFPTPSEILDNKELIYQTCGLGYRYEYVIKIAERFKNADLASFDASIKRLQAVLQDEKIATGKIKNDKAYDLLISFLGVGPKVANCTLLFGAHDIGRFPVDVWMQRIIDEVYLGRLNPDLYGRYAGVIQQYMFDYIKQIQT